MRVRGEALVLGSDLGYSVLTRWTATVRLRVTAPGIEPAIVIHQCLVERGRELVDGFVVPVDLDSADPQTVQIAWADVPTIESRIADRDPAILDPEGTWRRTRAIAAEPDRYPPWGHGLFDQWPTTPLPEGRWPAAAWVIARSADPRPHVGPDAAFVPPGMREHEGKVSYGVNHYRGWLLLCVLPERGERYAAYVRTAIRPDRLAPVLPVGLNPKQPGDLAILWDLVPPTVRLHPVASSTQDPAP
jgi:hypothetical protein